MNRNNDELTHAAQLDSYQHNHIFVLIQITVRNFCVKQRRKQCSCNIPRMISEVWANCKSQHCRRLNLQNSLPHTALSA